MMDPLAAGLLGGSAWTEQGFVLHPAAPSSLGFDVAEERLWVADNEGFLTSYTVPDLGVYSSTRAVWVGEEDDAKHATARWDGLHVQVAPAARCVPEYRQPCVEVAVACRTGNQAACLHAGWRM
jgi:hypothetical protein